MRPESGEAGAQARDPIEERNVLQIRLAAERVCALILYTDLPLIDIKLAAADVRRLCLRLIPDRAHLYGLIYGPRFRRLWEQWRGGERWL